MEYFQKPRIAVIGTSQWQLVFSELFEERRCILLKELIWVKGGGGGGGGGGGLRLHAKKIARYFEVGFYWQFFIAA